MLDERRLDQNAQGWFSIPWREGLNAVSLAHAAFFDLEFEKKSAAILAVAQDLGLWLSERRTDTFTYWLADEALSEIGSSSPFLRAALRCLQIRIARSDGDGEVYNAILRPTFDFYQTTPEIELNVERHRMLDALGGYDLKVARHDNERRKKAFQIAWRRGLYRAAYAL